MLKNKQFSIFLHLAEREITVKSKTWVVVENLKPASYYKVRMKAINKNTESFEVKLHQFTS